MKATSKELLEAVSKHCYNELTLYRYNTTTLQVSDKYRQGRLTALEYLTELSYYYMKEEKSLEDQFKEQIMKQLELHSCLNDSEYKRGLYDALNEVLSI